MTYLRGRPDCLHITVSDVNSINRPCCVIPKIECAKFNHSSDNNKRFFLKFWLLTLETVDKNSWEKIIKGISNLEETGDFLIPTKKIVSEKKLNNYRLNIMKILAKIVMMERIQLSARNHKVIQSK